MLLKKETNCKSFPSESSDSKQGTASQFLIMCQHFFYSAVDVWNEVVITI